MDNLERLTRLKEIIRKLQHIDIHTNLNNLIRIKDELFIFFNDLFGYAFKDDECTFTRSGETIELIYEFRVMKEFKRSIITKSDVLVVIMELFKIALKGKCRLYVGNLEAIPFYGFIMSTDFSDFIQNGDGKGFYYLGDYDLLEKIGQAVLSEYVDEAILKELTKRKDALSRNRALLDCSIKPNIKNLILNLDKLEYIMYSVVLYINENKNRYQKNITTSINRDNQSISF